MTSPADATAEVLSRFSVFDLHRQTHADLDHGDELFYKAERPIEIIDSGITNLIRWWQVRSGENEYEVRRFENFVFCSCRSFFYTRRMCKHLAFTTGVYCARCRVLSAKVGKLCYDCHTTVNQFLKPSPSAINT